MIPIRTDWGGRAERFRDMPGASLRAQDPTTYEFVQFQTPLHSENWLSQRFRPDVKALHVFNAPLPIPGGTGLAHPSLLVTKRSGEQEIQLVARGKSAHRYVAGTKRLARALGATFVLRELDAIRLDTQLLDDLEYLLQAACAHADQAVQIGTAVLNRATGPSLCCVGDLRDAMPTVSNDVIDGAVARLHMLGKVNINFAHGGRYGSRTRIAVC